MKILGVLFILLGFLIGYLIYKMDIDEKI